MQATFPAGKVSHFLLTRFNVRCFGVEELSSVELERRFKLFERFTLPSVAAQTETGFTFVCLFDQHTPEPWLRRIEAARTHCPNIKWALVNQEDIVAALQPLIPAQTEWLITTRLDNDDAISTDFIARTQQAVQPVAQSFVNFCRGFVYELNDKRLYKRTYLYNPFISVTEKRTDFSGIYHYTHSEIHHDGHVTYDWGPPAFLQIVHGGNLLNSIRGSPDASANLENSFGLASGTLPIEKHDDWFEAVRLTVEENFFMLKQLYHLRQDARHGNLKRCLKSLLA